MHGTIRGMSLKMMKLSQIAVILLWPTSLLADAKEVKIQALLCYSKLEISSFIFYEQDDGLLSLIGEDEVKISKNENSVTVIMNDSVFHFQGNKLQTLSNGTSESSLCSDVTEGMSSMYEKYFEVGQKQTINMIPMVLLDMQAFTANTATEPASAPAPEPYTSDAVADALAAAVNNSANLTEQERSTMTDPERESFIASVNSCWNVDSGSVAARVIIEVGFSLTREGRVEGEPRLLSSDGDQSATSTAFEAARRAILRCQGGGYELPADQYDQWKESVIVFDPAGVRLR